eukprot:8219434-Lingulodinium_polyedra.AAC.1
MPNTETETDKAERQRLRLRPGLEQREWQRERDNGRTEYRDRKGQTQRGTESKKEADPRPDTQRRNNPI